jgi:hypothetical protein
MPSYDALTEFLNGTEGAEITLTFAQLDRIVGGLPASARKHQAWWANSMRSQPHARAWLNARRSAQVDFVAGQVRFTRGAAGPSGPRRGRESTPVRVVEAPTFEPTGEAVTGEISYAWLAAGAVVIAGERLAMPVLGVRPGIYRFELKLAEAPMQTYVGEAENLERRMGHYRNPGSGQPTNLRLNRLLKDALAEGGSVAVSVVLGASFAGRELDLGSKPARLLVESAALVTLAGAGAAIENL